jgi:hypothetical protein
MKSIAVAVPEPPCELPTTASIYRLRGMPEVQISCTSEKGSACIKGEGTEAALTAG